MRWYNGVTERKIYMFFIKDNSFPFVKGVKKNKATTPFLMMKYFDSRMKRRTWLL